MKRNIIHKLQSQTFKIWSPFNFLNKKEAYDLVESLENNVKQSGYCPDVVVGISSGGDYPAEELSKRLNTPLTKVKISHYNLNFGGIEFDEIIGAYRIAKALGHKPKIELIKDVNIDEVKGKKILIIDDDSYSGKTLEVAKKSIKMKNPLDVKTGVLHTYLENHAVDFSGKCLPKKDFYNFKYRFPWSKISPYYETWNSNKRLNSLIIKSSKIAA